MKFDDLDTQQQLYISSKMSALGINNPRLVAPDDIEKMLEYYKPAVSDLERNQRSWDAVTKQRRERREKAKIDPLEMLPDERQAQEIAKNFGVNAAHIRTKEQAKREIEFQQALVSNDLHKLAEFGQEPNDSEIRQQARAAAENLLPNYFTWED